MRGPHYTGDINEPYVREDLALERQGELTDHIIQLQAEVARLNENVNKLNNALEQALRYEEWVYSDEKRCPELAAWLKENR